MNWHKVRKYSLIAVCALLGLLALIIIDALIKTNLVGGRPVPVPATKLIEASPISIDQIVGISKFRSCQGHDNSGKGPEGFIENERSMKHYLVPRKDLSEQLGVIEIFAPFDGKVVFALPGSHGSEIMIAPNANPNWALIVFHIDLKQGVDHGTQVKTGDLIGHANVKGRHDFDLGFTYSDRSLIVENLLTLFNGSPHFMSPKATYLDSIFNHMTPRVLQQFDAAGFDTTNMMFSREYRNANPCDYSKYQPVPEDWQYLPGHDPHRQGEGVPTQPS